MHILIIIHVLQNGTRWLPFITVVEDNIFPHPHDSESYFGTFGHPNKLPASQDSAYVKFSQNKWLFASLDMSLKTQCNVVKVSVMNQEKSNEISIKNHYLDADLHSC